MSEELKVTLDLAKDKNGLLSFDTLRALRHIYHSLDFRDRCVLDSSPDSPIIRRAPGTRAEHFAEWLKLGDQNSLSHHLDQAHYDLYLNPER